MAFEFKRLADVEALSEVPENATVLAEVNGAIKRIPSVGLGGGSGNTIVIVENPNAGGSDKAIDDSSTDEFMANMDFADALAAFRTCEITGAVLYSFGVFYGERSVTPTENMSLEYLRISDASWDYTCDCLKFVPYDGGYGSTLYWTSYGLSTWEPESSGGAV